MARTRNGLCHDEKCPGHGVHSCHVLDPVCVPRCCRVVDYLLLAEDFPANATGYRMTAADLRAWAAERVVDHLRRLGGAIDLGEASIAEAVRARGWQLYKVVEED